MKSLGKALKDGGIKFHLPLMIALLFLHSLRTPNLEEWSSDKFLMQLFKLNG